MFIAKAHQMEKTLGPWRDASLELHQEATPLGRRNCAEDMVYAALGDTLV